jgi:hypothetical protein
MGQLAAGLEQEQSLRDAGFGDDDINKWRADTTQKLAGAGFSDKEVGDYFGQAPKAEPDMAAMKSYVHQNLAAHAESQKNADGTPKPQDPTAHPAQGVLDAMQAGWQMSVTGLMKSNKLPDTVLPEDADWAMKLASQAGTIAGDIPAMVAGGIFGGAAGSEVPLVGNAIGAAAGMWAAPAAIRTAYIQHLQKGDIKDFGDFFTRAAAITWEATKAGVVGAATEGAGGATASALKNTALSATTQTGTKLMAELATMTTVGKAMEGQIPKAQDFLDGAIALAAMHTVGEGVSKLPKAAENIQTKLQDIYAKTGLKPHEVLEQAVTDPVLKQDLLSDKPEIPSQFKGLESRQPGQEIFDGGKPVTVDAAIPAQLGEKNPVLGDGFSAEEPPKVKQEPKPEPREFIPSEKQVRSDIGVDDEQNVFYQGVRANNVDSKHGRSGWWTINKDEALAYARSEGPGGRLRVTTEQHFPEGTFADADGNPITAEEHLKTTSKVGVGHHLADEVNVLKEYDLNSNSSRDPMSDRDLILSRIGEKKEADPGEGWDNWYTKTVDKLNPIAKLRDAITNGEEIPKKEDPYAIMGSSLSRGFARADEAVNHGPVDYKSGELTGGKGMKEILEPFKDDVDGLKAYGLAKRAIERDSKGINTGIDVEASRRYVNENFGKYDKAFQDLVEFQNSGLKYIYDAGLLDTDSYNKILTDSKDYFPMRSSEVEGAGSKGSSKNPIKKMFGSEDKKIDPFEQIIKNQYAYYRMAEENRGKVALVTLAEKSGKMGSDLIEKVPTPMAPVKVSDAELNTYLAKYGIHEGDPEAMTIFRPMARELGKDEISVMREGKQEIYSVDPSVAKALAATSYSEPNMVMKIANAFATAQRVGITENPFFLLKHAIRDQATATIQSENNYRPVIDGMRGLVHYFKGSDEYMEFLRNGGGMSTLADFDKQYIKNDVWGLSKETGLIDKGLNVVKTPLDLMKTLAEATFTAPKMGEYLRARENGKDPFTAAYEARNVTVDIQRTGSSDLLRAWSAATPFMNMRIRGMDQMVRTFQDNPTRTATKMALAITLPSLAVWWLNKDDPRYRDAPNWEKDLYWIIPTGTPENGVTYRIPKPFEPGLLFGSFYERLMAEFYDKKPEAFKHFGEALFGDALPNVVPPVVMPALEQFGNRSWLTGGNIVPHRLEGVAPEYQYTPYTSETAKAIGKAIGYIPGLRDIGHKNITVASPVVIENYVRAWTGETGMYVLHALDMVGEAAGVFEKAPAPTSTLADIPYVKQFIVRYPGASSQSIQDFYDHFDASQTVFNTKQALAKSGDVKAAYAYMNSPEAQSNMANLSGIAASMSKQHAAIQNIYRNPDMTPNDKRQLIDKIYYMMIQQADYGNKMMDEMKKAREADERTSQ